MLCRADTARTMVSRAHSTTDLSRGLSHILLDSDAKLPDNLEELQEHWGLIQSLEGVNLQVFLITLATNGYIFIYVFGATPPHPSGAGTTTG